MHSFGPHQRIRIPVAFVLSCKTISAKHIPWQPALQGNSCLNHPFVYNSILHPPWFIEELILLWDSIPVVEALSRMLAQLFRPDPAMSGTNRGIIIGQDFILLTHHDIPPQPQTLYSTTGCHGLRCINAFQISLGATGVKARRPDGLECEPKVYCLLRCRRSVNWNFTTGANILAVVSWEVGAGGQACIVLSRQQRGTQPQNPFCLWR